MDKTITKISVFFESPFWVGIYERESNRKYEACKIVFGSEPKDYEVYEYFLKNWNKLKFSPSLKNLSIDKKRVNPKRMQRLINKQLQNYGIGTNAQQSLGLMCEQNKLKCKSYSREKIEYEKKKKFELHKTKQKEKRKGH